MIINYFVMTIQNLPSVNGVKAWIKMIATIMVKETEDFMANKPFFFQ
jgi:hypothetical protein